MDGSLAEKPLQTTFRACQLKLQQGASACSIASHALLIGLRCGTHATVIRWHTSHIDHVLVMMTRLNTIGSVSSRMASRHCSVVLAMTDKYYCKALSSMICSQLALRMSGGSSGKNPCRQGSRPIKAPVREQAALWGRGSPATSRACGMLKWLSQITVPRGRYHGVTAGISMLAGQSPPRRSPCDWAALS